MVKRLVYAVVALSLLFGAVEATVPNAASAGRGSADHTATIVVREATMISPLASLSRPRRAGTLTAAFFTVLVAIVGALLVSVARRIRIRRAAESFAISRRGPPALLVVS